MTPPPLRLAATAIPLRPSTSNGVEVLMVRRNRELSFGGLWTFPGGTLEPTDGSLPETLDESSQDWTDSGLLSAAAAAAVRETREETALRCDRSTLTWFSHWIPPGVNGPPKRFATWFFLSPHPVGDIVVDLTENSEAKWVRPREALAEHASGDFAVAVPTWITLDDLASFDSIETAVSTSRSNGTRFFHTRTVRTEAAMVLLWSGDGSYDSEDIDRPGPRNRVKLGRSGVVGPRELSD